LCFFFQAEDGIRDFHVTGVQTCALPILYLYQNGFLHAKTIVVDGKLSSVGTANIDVRSFRLNFEVNAFIYDPKFALRLVKIFEDDIKLSTQMTKSLYQKRSIVIRFKESISRLLSPIL